MQVWNQRVLYGGCKFVLISSPCLCLARWLCPLINISTQQQVFRRSWNASLQLSQAFLFDQILPDNMQYKLQKFKGTHVKIPVLLSTLEQCDGGRECRRYWHVLISRKDPQLCIRFQWVTRCVLFENLQHLLNRLWQTFWTDQDNVARTVGKIGCQFYQSHILYQYKIF